MLMKSLSSYSLRACSWAQAAEHLQVGHASATIAADLLQHWAALQWLQVLHITAAADLQVPEPGAAAQWLEVGGDSGDA